jgi:hypothetical protein
MLNGLVLIILSDLAAADGFDERESTRIGTIFRWPSRRIALAIFLFVSLREHLPGQR